MNGKSLELCLRSMASVDVDGCDISDEDCLEVLSACEFLGLVSLRRVAARRCSEVLTSMGEDAIRSIPREMAMAIAESATDKTWKSLEESPQLVWFVDGSIGEGGWKVVSEMRWRGQLSDVDGIAGASGAGAVTVNAPRDSNSPVPKDPWMAAFIEKSIQSRIDSISMSRKKGERIDVTPVSDSIASVIASGFRGHGTAGMRLRTDRASLVSVIAGNKPLREIVKSLDATGVECDDEDGDDSGDKRDTEQRANRCEGVTTEIALFPSLCALCVRGMKLRMNGVRSLVNGLVGSGSAHHLSRLNVSGCCIGVDGSSELSRLFRFTPNLEWLDVSGNQLHCAGAESISRALSTSCRRLHTLSMLDCKLSCGGIRSVFRALSEMPSLLSVCVGANSEHSLEDSSMESVASALGTRLRRNEQILSIDISGRQPLTSARIAELTERGVDVSGLVDSAASVSVVTQSIQMVGNGRPLLYKLTLDGISIGGSHSVDSIASCIGGGGLCCLSVCGCQLGDSDVSVLVSPRLVSLNVSGNSIGHVASLALRNCLVDSECQLTSLDVSACGMSGRDVSDVLWALEGKNESLTSLGIAGNNRMGPKTEEQIARSLFRNSSLTNLNLSWNGLRMKRFSETIRTLIGGCGVGSGAGADRSNSVLVKLDVSHNAMCGGLFAGVIEDAFPELQHLNVSHSATAREMSFMEGIGRVVSTHTELEEIVVSCKSIETIGPILDCLRSQGSRAPSRLRRLCVRCPGCVGGPLVGMAKEFVRLCELCIMSNREMLDGLRAHVDRFCGTHVELVPTEEIGWEFPTWGIFPSVPFPPSFVGNCSS